MVPNTTLKPLKVLKFRFFLLIWIQGIPNLLKNLRDLIASKGLLSFILVAKSAAPEFDPGHVNMDHFFDILFRYKIIWSLSSELWEIIENVYIFYNLPDICRKHGLRH